MQDDALYALKDENVRRRRRAMLTEPHMKPLRDFVDEMNAARGDDCGIPDFDPLDGGVHARALFLFEAPGGGADDSVFVSRDNPDKVAVIFRNFCEENSIARKDTICWNVVPWWVEGGVSDGDVPEALPYLRQLISKLPELEAIVLFGTRASSLQRLLASETKLPVLATWMPSPRVFNRWKEKKSEVEETFEQVARILRR